MNGGSANPTRSTTPAPPGIMGQFLEASASCEKGDLPASNTSCNASAVGSLPGPGAGGTDANLATTTIPANSAMALTGRLPDKQLQSQTQRASDTVPALPAGAPPRPLGQRSAAPRPNRCWATPQNNQNQESSGSTEKDAPPTADDRLGAGSARVRTPADGRRPLPAPASGRPGPSQGACASSGNNASPPSPPQPSASSTQPATSSKSRQSASRPLSAQGSASAPEASSSSQIQTIGSLPQTRSGRGADAQKYGSNPPSVTVVEHPQQHPERGVGPGTDMSKRVSSTSGEAGSQNACQRNGQHDCAEAAKNSQPKHLSDSGSSTNKREPCEMPLTSSNKFSNKATSLPKAALGGATDNSASSGIKPASAIPSGNISTQRGPGADGDPEGALYGAEFLPMVGAAGVLVLPRRAEVALSSKAKQASKAEAEEDVVALLGNEELFGWVDDTAEERAPHRLYDAHMAAKEFKKYVAKECSASDLPWPSEQPIDLVKVRVFTAEMPPSKPAQGPGLLQLARDPRRREECPICSAEWSQAMTCIAEGRPPPEKEALPTMGRRQSISRKKMHSLRCNWAWFQQNLCAALCALRFDPKGAARPSPPSPGRILPPPMFDIWQYWKKTGRASDNRERQAASERLTRGESVTA
eukprot:TRINITY_DN105248_c0_g1_i1.p1 TRINITY_DN105248_c0_g1~~TRINITY_DN105248_c0_g1_i1.p1  ORF type:complete len:642 (+),score=110.64 TRINITY_DN105248_c0_g1_i1:551-2476(+)